jgi:hypothetical protein
VPNFIEHSYWPDENNAPQSRAATTGSEMNKTVEHEKARFLTEMKSGDPVGVLIRGHLYLEAMLIQLIETRIPKARTLDLNFPTKVNLAVAMSLMRDSDRPALIAINKLRNRLAHEIDINVTSTDEKNLQKIMPKALRDVISRGLSREPNTKTPALLKWCMLALYSMLLNARFNGN